jgi:hypothetical protein
MNTRWVLSLVGTVMLAGCGGEPDNQDDGVIEASDTTKQELGVMRWYTKGAPTFIEGHDDNDQVVVELRHDVTDGDAATTHTFTLRSHHQGAARTFAFAKDPTGQDRVLQERFSQGFDHEHVLDLMKADIQASEQKSSSPSLVANVNVGGGLHPADALIKCGNVLVEAGKLPGLSQTCLDQARAQAAQAAQGGDHPASPAPPAPSLTDKCRNQIQLMCSRYYPLI